MKFTNEKSINHKSKDIGLGAFLSLISRIFLRYVFVTAAVIMLFWFLLPMFTGIIDIGNIFGLTVCILYILWARNSFLFAILKEFITKDKAGKMVMTILYIFLSICVIYALVVSVFMGIAASDKPKNSRTTLIVLGCKVNDTSPSKSLARRLEAAYNYLSKNQDAVCIVSGGKGYNENISEADCMYNYLTEKGIDGKRIYKEDKSANTDENIRFSKKIIEQNNLSDNITIVTDGYHQLRAGIIAKKNSVSVTGAVSAKTPPEVLPTYWVREWFAIPVEIIK